MIKSGNFTFQPQEERGSNVRNWIETLTGMALLIYLQGPITVSMYCAGRSL